ncbi:MAG: hypothetical protein IJV38_06980 [Prevotella sp.]|nr:hypothetical protein [Prevotella sp.]
MAPFIFAISIEFNALNPDYNVTPHILTGMRIRGAKVVKTTQNAKKKRFFLSLWDENARNIKQNSYKGGAMRKKMS